MVKLVALALALLCGTAQAQQVIGQGRFINVSATNNVQAARFYGDGANLTNVPFSPSPPQGGVQFNSGGIISATSGLTYVTATNTLLVSGGVSTSSLVGTGTISGSAPATSGSLVWQANTGLLKTSSNLKWDFVALNVPGNISTTGGISATGNIKTGGKFQGDGSELTNLPSSSGAWTLLAAKVITSGVSEVSFTSIASGYDVYAFRIIEAQPNSANALSLQMSTDNGGSWTDYTYVRANRRQVPGGTSTDYVSSGWEAAYALAGASVATGAPGVSGQVEITGLTSVGRRYKEITHHVSYMCNGTSLPCMEVGGGMADIGGAVNAVRIYFLGGGNTVVSATVAMYGIDTTP